MPLGWLDHFEILRLLGRGGMSDVYFAHDSRLDCDVAVKVLREDHAGDSAHRARLLGEARALAKLDHPNVIGILGCGEAAPVPPGFLWPEQSGPHPEKVVYFAMRYGEGVDLSEVIRAGRLPLGRVVDYAKQIARGLEAAHAHGVVHRDLKPANIRVTSEGVLKLVDFGLASSGRLSVESMDPTVTPAREYVVGTVGYSAPEQCEEAGHADPRCDLFSLGVILYELVAGRRPFQGAGIIEVLHEIATHDPPPLGRYANGVPAELERITGKLLQKDPKRRYQSAHEVLTDLEAMGAPAPRAVAPRQLGWAALALVVAATVFGTPFFCRPSPPETVAVVEFENLTGDPAMDRIAAGLGLDLLTTIVQACRVNVVVSTLHDAAGRPVRDPAKVAREYGASMVLLGALHSETVTGQGRLISLNLRIVRARDNTTRWARDWDAPTGDVTGLLRQMTVSVIAFWPRVPNAAAGELDHPSGRPGGAEEAYLRGRALLEETDPVARDSSLAEFDRALALDPQFGRALAGRARARLAAYLRDLDTTRLAPAELDARRAVALAGSEAEGRIALARILRVRGRNAEAIEQLRIVLSGNDRQAEAYSQLGAAYAALGDVDHADEYFRQSLALQPASLKLWRSYGRFLLQTASNLPAAEKAFRTEIRLAPEKNRGYEELAATYVMECRYAEAIATFAKLPNPGEGSLDRAGNRGTAYYFNGNYDLALRDYLAAVSGSPEDGSWRINLGDCYAHVGRLPDALREYRLAVRYFERDMVTDSTSVVGRARYAKGLAKAGDTARARDEAERCALADPWRDAEAVHDLAMALALCGERERALDALDTLVNRRGYSRCLLRVEDEFAGLRGQPRFRALVGDAKR